MLDARFGPDQGSSCCAISLGAHLVTRRFGYTHHGIYVGDGKVVHYAGLAGVLSRGPVEEVSFADFAGGRVVRIKPEPAARFAADIVAERARSRLGESRYRLISNNCEHFSAWCLHGEGRSEQVDQLLALPRSLTMLLARLKRSLAPAPASPRGSTPHEAMLDPA